MNWIFLVVSLLPTFLPWVGRGLQKAAQPMQAVQVVQQVAAQFQQQPIPPEAGQPGVVFHQGQWWKWDGQRWWVWTQNPPVQVAQGGGYVASR